MFLPCILNINFYNPALLSKPKLTLIALPLKITGGYGAPPRAMAIEE
jgi:kynurenine formamidase